MQLSIITINFKKPELTIACLTSLYTQYKEQFEKNIFELLIVDNFSNDNSLEVLEKEIQKQKYKNVSLLAHTENNGFGGGNNFGSQNARGSVLLFLNNDSFVKEGIPDMLVYLLDHKNIGVLGGVLKNVDGTIQSSYGKFYYLPYVLLVLLGLERLGSKTEKSPMQVDWVKGACFMIKKELFNAVGGFDEGIFMYTEDMELCYRITRKGKEVWIYPQVNILHEDQGSSNRTFAIVQIYQGIIYFYRKHRSRIELQVVKLLLQTKAGILVLLGKLTKNNYLVTTYEKALSNL